MSDSGVLRHATSLNPTLIPKSRCTPQGIRNSAGTCASTSNTGLRSGFACIRIIGDGRKATTIGGENMLVAGIGAKAFG